MKAVLLIKYSIKKIFIRKIQMTLKTENFQFLTVINQKALQDIKKSF